MASGTPGNRALAPNAGPDHPGMKPLGSAGHQLPHDDLPLGSRKDASCRQENAQQGTRRGALANPSGLIEVASGLHDLMRERGGIVERFQMSDDQQIG